jgi:hypothetical protein
VPRRKDPVLQRYQVEVRGGRYYVRDTKNDILAGGPYTKRETAQRRADDLEKRT